MQRIVLRSSLLWWELGTNSLITGPGEWLSFRRFTSKLSSWSSPKKVGRVLMHIKWTVPPTHRAHPAHSGIKPGATPVLIVPYLKMDYHKPLTVHWGSPTSSFPTYPGIRPGTVTDPFTNSPISQVGLSQPCLGQRRVPTNPPHPYPTRCKSRYRVTPPKQSSWTISTPLPAQKGHPLTHPIPYLTQYKSRNHSVPPQQSS